MRISDQLRTRYPVLLAGVVMMLSACVAVPDAPPASDMIVPDTIVQVPERPVTPDLPAVPDQPVIPDQPEVPDTPDAPEPLVVLRPELPAMPDDPRIGSMPLPEHPPRELPRPGGAAPDRRQGDALRRYVRGVQWDRSRGQAIIHSDLPRSVIPIVRELVRDETSEITLDRWHEKRGDVYYGRMDLTVHPPGWFSVHVPAVTIRGPTVFSRLSEIDAQLNSLHRLPAEIFEAARREIRRNMEQLVSRRGVLYRVEYHHISDPDEREWIGAALRSFGRPDDRDGDQPGRYWWLYLPPAEAAAYLEDVLAHLSLQINVVDRTNFVMMVYNKE